MRRLAVLSALTFWLAASLAHAEAWTPSLEGLRLAQRQNGLGAVAPEEPSVEAAAAELLAEHPRGVVAILVVGEVTPEVARGAERRVAEALLASGRARKVLTSQELAAPLALDDASLFAHASRAGAQAVIVVRTLRPVEPEGAFVQLLLPTGAADVRRATLVAPAPSSGFDLTGDAAHGAPHGQGATARR